MSTKTLKTRILETFRRDYGVLTVREVNTRIQKQSNRAGIVPPPYSSVRARTYELVKAGKLTPSSFTTGAFFAA